MSSVFDQFLTKDPSQVEGEKKEEKSIEKKCEDFDGSEVSIFPDRLNLMICINCGIGCHKVASKEFGEKNNARTQRRESIKEEKKSHGVEPFDQPS